MNTKAASFHSSKVLDHPELTRTWTNSKPTTDPGAEIILLQISQLIMIKYFQMFRLKNHNLKSCRASKMRQ